MRNNYHLTFIQTLWQFGEKTTRNVSFNTESGLTMRAPDVWDSARFQAVFVTEANSVKLAFSQPAQPPVTRAVSPQKVNMVVSL